MIPALIAVGLLGLSAGAVATSAAEHRPIVEKTVVVEQPVSRGAATARPSAYQRTSLTRHSAGQSTPAQWTPNVRLGQHNSFDADQG